MKKTLIAFISIITFIFSYHLTVIASDYDHDFVSRVNSDNSVSMEGILEKYPYEKIKVEINSKDAKLKTYTVETNSKGYFKLDTEPFESVPSGIRIFIDDGPQHAFTIGREYSRLIDEYRIEMEFEELSSNGEIAKAATNIELFKRKVTAGNRVAYAIDNKNNLWAWGDVGLPFCGNDTPFASTCNWRSPQKINLLTNVKQVTANGNAGAVLTHKGEVWSWGWAIYERINKAKLIGTFPDAVQVAVSSNGNGLLLKKDGTVHKWDLASIPEKKVLETQIKLEQIKELQGITKITISPQTIHGQTFLALQDNGSVWIWGNIDHIKGPKQQGSRLQPQLLKDIPKMKDIELYDDGRPLLLSEQFELWSYFNTDRVNQPEKIATNVMGIYKESNYILRTSGDFYKLNGRYLSTEPLKDLEDLVAITYGKSIYSNSDFYIGMKSDGSLTGWGSNTVGQLGLSNPNPYPQSPISLEPIYDPISISASNDHVLVLTKAGELYGWGNNKSNEINSNSNPEILRPYHIGTYTDAIKVATGNGFSLYINKSGELYGWGNIKWLGAENNSSAPVRLDYFNEPLADVSAASNGAVVLTQSGQVYHLGGEKGMYWNESMNKFENLVRKISITNVTSISAGDRYSLAIKNDGSLWNWGNTVVTREIVAEKVPGFVNIVEATTANANGVYTLAIDKKGELWGLGNNMARQLGHYTPSQMYKATNITESPMRNGEIIPPYSTRNYTPARVKLNYRSVSASKSGALLLTDQGEMLFFGTFYGPALTDKELHKNVSMIEVGGSNMYWVKDNKLWVFGSNNNLGQLGNGLKAYYERPQPVKTSNQPLQIK